MAGPNDIATTEADEEETLRAVFGPATFNSKQGTMQEYQVFLKEGELPATEEADMPETQVSLQQQIEQQFEELRIARFVTFNSRRYMEVNEWLLEHTPRGFVWSEELRRYVLRDVEGYPIED